MNLREDGSWPYTDLPDKTETEIEMDENLEDDPEDDLEDDLGSTLSEDESHAFSSFWNRVENSTFEEQKYPHLSERNLNDEQQNQHRSNFAMVVQLQEIPEESSIEREKLSPWIHNNKEKAHQLETHQKELAEREHECSEKEHRLSVWTQDNKQISHQLKTRQKELAERERECNDKELRLTALAAKFQAQEDEQNRVIKVNTLVSQSSQTNQVDTHTDNTLGQVNIHVSIPQYIQASDAETESNNVSIAVQTNMSISIISQACQVETCMTVHQRQTHQDAAAQTAMDILQSSQSRELYPERPAQRNSHDKAVQVNIALPVSTSPSEPHLPSCCQETKKQMHSTFMTNMTNCKRGIITALDNTEVSELTYQ